MGFSLGDMFLSALLFTNAAAILHEKRFLNQFRMAIVHVPDGLATNAHPPDSLKAKVVGGLSAVRMLLKIPLIVFNSMVISYQLLFG